MGRLEDGRMAGRGRKRQWSPVRHVGQLGWALLSCGAALLGACSQLNTRGLFGPRGSTVAVAGPATTASGAGSLQGQVEPLADEPAKAMEQVAKYLAQRGYAPLGPPQDYPLPTSTGVMAVPLPLSAGRCYVLVAIAPKGVNLDVFVKDPFSRTLRIDARPDRHPWAAFCTDLPGRHTLQVNAPPGKSGTFRLGIFTGPPSVNPALYAFFAAAEPTEGASGAPSTAQLDERLKQRLEEAERRVAALGFQRATEPVAVAIRPPSGQAEINISLQPGCYRLVAVAGDGVRNADLVLLDASGSPLVQDRRPSRDAELERCFQQPFQGRLRTIAQGGQGVVAVAAYARGGTTAAGPSTIQAGFGGVQQAGGSAERFALVDADMRARGYERSGEPQRLSIQAGQQLQAVVPVEDGQCYAVVAVADAVQVPSLRAALLDPQGQPVRVLATDDGRIVLRACPSSAGNFQLVLQADRGTGLLYVARYVWPHGVEGPFGLRGLPYVLLSEFMSLFELEGYQPDESLPPRQGRFRRLGEVKRHRVRLRGGACYSVLGIGGEGVARLLVRVVPPRGTGDLLQDSFVDPYNPIASVRLCPRQRGTYTIEVELPTEVPEQPGVQHGPGPYVVQVFRQR